MKKNQGSKHADRDPHKGAGEDFSGRMTDNFIELV